MPSFYPPPLFQGIKSRCNIALCSNSDMVMIMMIISVYMRMSSPYTTLPLTTKEGNLKLLPDNFGNLKW
jgi:hypothetical protein